MTPMYIRDHIHAYRRHKERQYAAAAVWSTVAAGAIVLVVLFWR